MQSSMQREQASELVRRMAEAWIRADIAAILELFAPDAVFISPGGAASGHAEIAAAAAAYFGFAERVDVRIRHVLLDGKRGVAEWVWYETPRGSSEARVMEDAVVFETRDGKLVYWREYFDPAQAEMLEP